MLTVEGIQNLFVHHAFVAELMSSCWLFCHFFQRKDHFVWRALLVFLCLLSNSVLWNTLIQVPATPWQLLPLSKIFKYAVDFAIGYWGVMFCTESESYATLFCMICGLATQHLSYRVYSSILVMMGLQYNSLVSASVIVAVMILIYLAVYFLFVRDVKKQPEGRYENKMNILVGGILVFLVLVLHFFTESLGMGHRGAFVMNSGYAILCCAIVLMLEHGLLQNNKLTSEKQFLEHLVHMQEEQYQNSKANVEMINIKCHDMKHQISHMTRNVDPAAIEELEQVIRIYDANLQTGNEILDIVLMEKKLLCEKSDIKLDCIVDGACLSFMQPSDIFSMFGNAIDNATEAVKKIADVERRIIALTVREQLGMVVIHVENNYEGELIMADGLPQTTKLDTLYHGYGVKSIRMVAEKYMGHVAVLPQDGIFNLNIMIPVPER